MKSKLILPLFCFVFILSSLKGICTETYSENKKTGLAKKITTKPGFIVLNTGDTLRGYIDYKQWGRNPTSIKFGTSVDLKNAKTYPIAELQSFEVIGFDHYQRAVIEKDARRLSGDFEQPGYTNAFVTDTVWLRRLVKGNSISFYQLIQDRPHYIFQKGGKYEELIYKKGKENGSYYDFRIYRTRLNEIVDNMGFSQDIKGRINKADYTEDDLTYIFEMMNGIGVEARAKNNKTVEVVKPSFLISAALSSSLVKVTGNVEEFLNMQFERATIPKIIAGVEFYGSRGLKDFTLNVGLGYSKVKYNGLGTAYNAVPKASYAIDQSNVSLNVGIGYDFISSSKLKANIGVNVGYVRSNYDRNEYKGFDSGMTIPNYLSLSKGYMEFNVTGGLRYGKHWGIILSTGQSMGYFEGSSIDLEISNISGGLSYHF